MRFDWNVDIESNTKLVSDRLDDLPDDFRFEYSIDGDETTLDRDQFMALGVRLANDQVLHPLLVDRNTMMTDRPENKLYEVGIRMRSPSTGYKSKLLLSHLYYA